MATGTSINPDNAARVIVLTFGAMEQGGMYWAYVAVKPNRYEEFKRVTTGKKYNIQNFVNDGFGEVIVSGDSGIPPREVTKQVAAMFNIPIKQLFADIDPLMVIEKGIDKLIENDDSTQ